MYSRRFTIALLTGRMKTTLSSAKKIAKLISCTTNVPSSLRNMGELLLACEVRDKRRNVDDHEQEIERQTQRDDRERFQHADAEEHEGQDVRAGFRLPRNGFHCFRCDV